MTLLDFFKNLSMGGWTSFFVMTCLLIEITPIKINPIGWLGNRLNASMYKRVDEIEGKLDTHIAEGYRNFILNFQRALLNNPNSQFTYEEWKKQSSHAKTMKHIARITRLLMTLSRKQLFTLGHSTKMHLKQITF